MCALPPSACARRWSAGSGCTSPTARRGSPSTRSWTGSAPSPSPQPPRTCPCRSSSTSRTSSTSSTGAAPTPTASNAARASARSRSPEAMAIAVPPDLERAAAEEVLAFATERFHPRLFVACSFQKEASVIMDMLVRIEPDARFFTLDTGVLFEETYDTWRELEERYDIKVEVFRGISLEEQARRHGDELWARDPDACCGIRKVSPLEQALSEVDAWVTGVRRDQSPLRASTPKIH